MAKSQDKERRDLKDIYLEDVSIFYRDFIGKVDKQYNPQGKKSFCVKINNEDTLNQMIEDGYTIKYLTNADGPDTPYTKVKVNYEGYYPPNIYTIIGRKKTKLNDETVKTLDKADIARVDLVISPFPYEIGGKTGTAAYVKDMYVTIVPDIFAAKYDFDDDEEVPFD